WMCQRVLFGPVKEPADTPDTSTGLTRDLTHREKSILAPIAICCVILGVYPKPMLSQFEVAIERNILGGSGVAMRASAVPDASFLGSDDLHGRHGGRSLHEAQDSSTTSGTGLNGATGSVGAAAQVVDPAHPASEMVSFSGVVLDER
ncbi:MAG: hypothetical protein JSU86_07285, partial [Phycisphaerales bacterium]